MSFVFRIFVTGLSSLVLPDRNGDLFVLFPQARNLTPRQRKRDILERRTAHTSPLLPVHECQIIFDQNLIVDHKGALESFRYRGKNYHQWFFKGADLEVVSNVVNGLFLQNDLLNSADNPEIPEMDTVHDIYWLSPQRRSIGRLHKARANLVGNNLNTSLLNSRFKFRSGRVRPQGFVIYWDGYYTYQLHPNLRQAVATTFSIEMLVDGSKVRLQDNRGNQNDPDFLEMKPCENCRTLWEDSQTYSTLEAVMLHYEDENLSSIGRGSGPSDRGNLARMHYEYLFIEDLIQGNEHIRLPPLPRTKSSSFFPQPDVCDQNFALLTELFTPETLATAQRLIANPIGGDCNPTVISS